MDQCLFWKLHYLDLYNIKLFFWSTIYSCDDTENISLGHKHLSITSNGFLLLIIKVVYVSKENFENVKIFLKWEQEKITNNSFI